MLPEHVDYSETLYRVIKRSKPKSIGSDGRVSSALFKESLGEGISVDRDGGRTDAEVFKFISEVTFPGRAKAIGSIDASYCFVIGADVKPDPNDNNEYHANIFLSEDEHKRNIQALQLADNCRIVYMDESIDWVV